MNKELAKIEETIKDTKVQFLNIITQFSNQITLLENQIKDLRMIEDKKVQESAILQVVGVNKSFNQINHEDNAFKNKEINTFAPVVRPRCLEQGVLFTERRALLDNAKRKPKEQPKDVLWGKGKAMTSVDFSMNVKFSVSNDPNKKDDYLRVVNKNREIFGESFVNSEIKVTSKKHRTLRDSSALSLSLALKAVSLNENRWVSIPELRDYIVNTGWVDFISRNTLNTALNRLACEGWIAFKEEKVGRWNQTFFKYIPSKERELIGYFSYKHVNDTAFSLIQHKLQFIAKKNLPQEAAEIFPRLSSVYLEKLDRNSVLTKIEDNNHIPLKHKNKMRDPYYLSNILRNMNYLRKTKVIKDCLKDFEESDTFTMEEMFLLCSKENHINCRTSEVERALFMFVYEELLRASYDKTRDCHVYYLAKEA